MYVPKEDREIDVIGWEKYFGRSEVESEKLTINIVEQAFSFGWPVIFHADLRKYSGVVNKILRANPEHRLIIPHFGFSRRIMSKFMERFEYCYTDFSSLLPFMERTPQSYLDFITNYYKRILFGTDTMLGDPSITSSYYKFINDLIPEDKIRKKVIYENYISIHG